KLGPKPLFLLQGEVGLFAVIAFPLGNIGQRPGRPFGRGVPQAHFAVKLPVARRLPSGLNATLGTWETCPMRGASGRPLVASHTRPVVSAAPVTRRLPSGLNATLNTGDGCPLRAKSSWPVAASHNFAVASQLEVAMRLPSGLNATLSTLSMCPLSSRTCRPVA